MKITTKTRYGLRALIYIAQRLRESDEPVRIKDISEAQKISVQYLEQILFKLKKADIVQGKRGPNGGYRIEKDIYDIRVSDIFKVLESDIKIISCGKNEKCVGEECTTAYLWNKLNKELESMLNETTLGEMLDANSSKNG